MVIGITGNFGVGKTTIANMFRRLGARVIDADQIAHMVIKPYSCAYKQIIDYFGREVLVGKYISRKKLSSIVFSDKKKLQKLNKITHPQIIKVIKKRIKKVTNKEILVIDAVLLIESGLLALVDGLIVVKLRPEIQIDRLKQVGFSIEQIKKRLSHQSSECNKIKFANFVIDNSGRRRQAERQVGDIWTCISKEGGRWKKQKRQKR